MDEPFDRRTMILSALWSGLGQLASGQTNKGLALLALGMLTGTLGGVTGLLLRVLTLGRLKILPARLNALAVAWLGVYLYNLYDAYNLASGAEEDEDLFEYEEYEPRTEVPEPIRIAGHTPEVFSGPPASAAAVGQAGAGGTPDAQGSDLASIGQATADLDQAASQLQAGGDSVGQGRAAANTGPVGPTAPPRESVTGVPPATTAGAHAAAAADRRFDFSTLGLPWDAGVTKAQLLDLLGDDEQVRGVFGHYLPSDRVFHSEAEVLTLIPVQAWQDAQGANWTGGDLPTSDQATGYGESAAGRMPPGDTSADTVH